MVPGRLHAYNTQVHNRPVQQPGLSLTALTVSPLRWDIPLSKDQGLIGAIDCRGLSGYQTHANPLLQHVLLQHRPYDARDMRSLWFPILR